MAHCPLATPMLQVWFNYIAASFSNHFAYTFPGRLRRDATVVIAFSPASLLVYGDDHHHSLPILLCSSKTPGHLTHITKSKRTPLFKTLSISGRISSQPAAFSVLTARETSTADGIFLPQMHFLCFRWCGSDWIQEVFEIISPSANKDVLLISEQHTIFVFDGSSNIR